jgi:hypothetical protein
MQKRARAGCFVKRTPGSWLNGDRFFHCFSESLTHYRKLLQVLILRRGRSSTAFAHSRAPASTCTGRLGQWLGSLSGWHAIGYPEFYLSGWHAIGFPSRAFPPAQFYLRPIGLLGPQWPWASGQDRRVPGDHRVPNPIAWVGKHRSHKRKLKRGREEYELTGKGLAAVKFVSRWRKPKLGEIRN